MTWTTWAALAAASSVCLLPPVLGLEMRQVLPTNLAVRAAEKAVKECEKQGQSVTATVIEPNGLVIAVIRNSKAGPHTVENSYNKAYTVSSFGRISRLQSTRALIEGIKGARGIGTFPLPADPLTGLSYSIGGLAINSKKELIGAIGVSGSPNGNIDESCAAMGLEAIKPELDAGE